MTLVAALKELPVDQRKALALHYLFDRPVSEIAEETSTNVNTVKTWLSRGRAALFEKLAETHFEEPNLRLVRDRARKRRNRTLTMTIAAFLATATAAAAGFFAVPRITTPAIHPDLVLPYGAPPVKASNVVIGQRVITLWTSTDGQARMGAIDLATGAQSWPTATLGSFDYSVGWLGVTGGVLVLAGEAKSGQDRTFVLIGVDVATGKLRWQHRPLPLANFPIISPPSMTSRNNPAAPAVIVLKDGQSYVAVDSSTGETRWSTPAQSIRSYGRSTGDHIPEQFNDGSVNVRDLRTGRIISSRAGMGQSVAGPTAIIGDWLFFVTESELKRMPVAGSDPAITVTQGIIDSVFACGDHVCATGVGFVAAFDPRDGKQLWRKNVRDSGTSRTAMDPGLIMTIPGKGQVNQFGIAADDRAAILDAEGKEITPGGLGSRVPYWLDADHLMFSRLIKMTTPSNPYPIEAELSVYSYKTGKEQPLSKTVLYGPCAGIPGSYICPGPDGFMIYRY